MALLIFAHGHFVYLNVSGYAAILNKITMKNPLLFQTSPRILNFRYIVFLLLTGLSSCSKQKNDTANVMKDTVVTKKLDTPETVQFDTLFIQPDFDYELVSPTLFAVDELGTAWTKEINAKYRIISDKEKGRLLIYKDKKLLKKYDGVKGMTIKSLKTRSGLVQLNKHTIITVETYGLWTDNQSDQLTYFVDNQNTIRSSVRDLRFSSVLLR